ncbi:MAG: tetratricopeptide repeat protein, partial [Methylococcales bacterium]|nr:tetratricopeptide repeat protein [Methylococcales bacterium]
MKSLILLAIALVFGGVISSIMLIPTDNEIALLQFKDKKFDDAKTMYETRIESGDLSVSVVMPLSQLYLQYGDVNKAVELMERFIKSHPKNIDALLRLGKLYQYAQRPYDHLRVLETVVELQPTEERLMDLSKIYNFIGRYKKQIETLRSIIEQYPNNEKAYLDLANLQASQGLIEDAIKTQDLYIKKHPGRVTVDTVMLSLSLKLNDGQFKIAEKLANDWLKSNKNDYKAALKFGGLFQSKRKPKITLDMIKPFEEIAKGKADYLSMITELEVELGQSKTALSRLMALYKNNELPKELWGKFIELTFSAGNTKLAMKVAKQTDISSLPDWLVVNMIESAIFSRNIEFMEWIHIQLEAEFKETHPVLLGRLTEAKHNLKLAKKWANKAYKNTDILLLREKINLAQLFIKLKNNDIALALLMELAKHKDTPDQVLADMTDLFLKLKKEEQGFVLYQKIRKVRNSPAIEAAYVLMATASKKQKMVLDWLESGNKKIIPNRTLLDIYYVSLDKKIPKVALNVANILYDRKKGSNEIWFIAQAHMALNNPEKALPLLRELKGHNAQIDAAYEEALIQSWKKGINVTAELKDHLLKKLEQPFVSLEQRRGIVFQLLEMNEKGIAVEQLKIIAENVHPKSNDVSQLLYIWGPRPEKQHMDWLEKQTTNSKHEYLHIWLKYLMDFGHPKRVVNVVNKIKFKQRNDKINDIFVDSLVLNNDYKQLGRELTQLVKVEKRIPRLSRWAKTAKDQNLLVVAEKTYKKILKIDEDHIKTLRTLGLLTYHQGKRQETIEFLSHYHQLTEGDWETYYFLGEALSVFNEFKRSVSLYYKTLDKISDMDGELPYAVKVVKAQILHRIKGTEASIESFNELSHSNPGDLGVRADFAAMLMETK